MTNFKKNISSKQLDILFKIIDLHIENGEPVGSRVLSKLNSIDISPASLRNIMLDLSESSMLSQPHTSAGRIPTDQGYRLYVDSFMKKVKFNLSDEKLKKRFEEIEDNLDDLLRGTSELIASETNMMSVVTPPRPVKSRMKIIEFLALNERQILVLLVTKTGMVTNKVVYVRESFNKEFLESLSKYFNGRFGDKPLPEVRDELLNALSSEMKDEPKNFAKALRLCKKAFDLGFSGNLYVQGQSNFFSWPEFSNQNSFIELFRALEDHTDLIELFESKSDSTEVLTYIGHEHSIENLQQCSVVFANYGVQENALGSIAVLGPKRLNYSKVIPLIGYMAKMLSKRLVNIVE